jgi:hypothetical protein
MLSFSQDHVEKMLDYIDCNAVSDSNSKRRDAYVTERYFETDILPMLTKGNASTGWCYLEEKWIRNWFKVMINPSDIDGGRKTDKKIIEQLKQRDPRQRFYIVYLDSAQNTVTISIREIIKENNEWILRVPQRPLSFCDMEAMNNEALRLSALPQHPVPFSNQWLKHCDKAYLKRILIQRLFMNIALGGQFPLDVDAIEVDDGQLIFHEFKRKNKCPSGCFIMNDDITRWYLLGMVKECNAKKLTYGPELFEFVEQRFGYKRDETAQCYGLDMSHLSNFEFCAAKNIVYRHTIWDSGNYPDKPRISDLFDADIKPKKEVHLVLKDLESRDFIGFIFTKGRNSGSFTKKLRGQATMDACSFQDINGGNN